MTFRLFVAYDAEQDQATFQEIQAESGHKGLFVVCGHSAKGPMTDEWAARSRRAIEQADQIVVVCGELTAECSRVAAELQIARDLETPFTLLWSSRDIMCTKPQGAGTTDTMYSWTTDILHQQLLANQRANAPRPVVRKPMRAAVSAPAPALEPEAAQEASSD